MLARLKEIGVRISIDDFGTGYSSLAYLRDLPTNILQIYKSFAGGLGENAEDTAIVRMAVHLAHTLGMQVIAEGVERADQLAQLEEMGCDMAQGYYFAPAPPGGGLPLPRERGLRRAYLGGVVGPAVGPLPGPPTSVADRRHRQQRSGDSPRGRLGADGRWRLRGM